MQHDAAIAQRVVTIDRCGELLVAREVASTAEDTYLTNDEYYFASFVLLKHQGRALSLPSPRDLGIQAWGVGDNNGTFNFALFFWPNGQGAGRKVFVATATLGTHTETSHPVDRNLDNAWRAADTLALASNVMNAIPTNSANELALLNLDAYGLPHLAVQIRDFTNVTRGLVVVRVP